MSNEPDPQRGYRNVQETDAWAAEPLVPIDVTFDSPIDGGWLADAPETFDTRHDETARFIATDYGVTPTILQDFRIDDLQESVPMGRLMGGRPILLGRHLSVHGRH